MKSFEGSPLFLICGTTPPQLGERYNQDGWPTKNRQVKTDRNFSVKECRPP